MIVPRVRRCMRRGAGSCGRAKSSPDAEGRAPRAHGRRSDRSHSPYRRPADRPRRRLRLYGALAITLHERQLDVAPLVPYAAERGVTLIPGVERTVEGRHVLLLNFRRGAEDVRTFDDLARLRQREAGLVVAPHPFFPLASCLRGYMDRYAPLFDAAEINAMFTRAVDFNQSAKRWADRYGKPLVRRFGVRFHLPQLAHAAGGPSRATPVSLP